MQKSDNIKINFVYLVEIAFNDGIDLLLAFEYYSITLFLLNYESHIDIGNLRNWVTWDQGGSSSKELPYPKVNWIEYTVFSLKILTEYRLKLCLKAWPP